MDPREINYLLSLRNYTQSRLAKELRIQPSAVSSVIAGRARSRKIETAVSEVLRLRRHRIWPDRYDEQDRAIRPKRRKHSARSIAEIAEALEQMRAAA